MPLIIKDYDWKETETILTIKVPLHGVHSSKVDLFHSNRYLKAAFEQYFFDVVLKEEINTKQSTCIITSSDIVFELKKNTPSIWGTLEPTDLNKQQKFELKQKLIAEEHKRFQDECEEKRNVKAELGRVAVQEQMGLDAKQRKKIETIKQNEREKALGDLDEWKRQISNKKIEKRKVLKSEKKRAIPPPRPIRTLETLFTPREFPTPIRESRIEEENEWLRKQTEARRSAGFISEDIRPEERNPQFLKAKGDEFMDKSNYLGAVSAYSFGIKISEKYADLYVGRAEAHFKLGNMVKTLDDCSKALELMKPRVEGNRKERALCLGRRGIALVELGLIKQGIGELEASLKLVSDDKYFEEKLNYARDKLHNNDDKEEQSDILYEKPIED